MATITIDMDTITEEEAVRLYFAFQRHFGWGGTFFNREDAETSWKEYHNQTDEFTDDIWSTVWNSYYWRKGLSEQLTEHGWEIVHSAVYEAIQDEESE